MSNFRTLLAFIMIFQIMGCNSKAPSKAEEIIAQVSTPVTITSISTTSISELISFNAVSAYQRKNIVKSTINGYIDKSFVNQGDIVKAGQPLYAIKTKEGDALSKFAAKDSLLTFKGKLTIVSPATGIVTEATKQTNDYIGDGEQLCIIAVQSSFVFLLNIPYEQNKYAVAGSVAGPPIFPRRSQARAVRSRLRPGAPGIAGARPGRRP